MIQHRIISHCDHLSCHCDLCQFIIRTTTTVSVKCQYKISKSVRCPSNPYHKKWIQENRWKLKVIRNQYICKYIVWSFVNAFINDVPTQKNVTHNIHSIITSNELLVIVNILSCHCDLLCTGCFNNLCCAIRCKVNDCWGSVNWQTNSITCCYHYHHYNLRRPRIDQAPSKRLRGKAAVTARNSPPYSTQRKTLCVYHSSN